MATQPARNARDELVARLSALSDREFVEVFYAVTARRRPPGLADWKAHWVLAEAEKVGREPWSVDFLAAAREDVDDGDRAISREATCPRCRNPVRSWARTAGCPICARTVFCT